MLLAAMVDGVVIAVSPLEDPVDDAVELGDTIVGLKVPLSGFGSLKRANVLDRAGICILWTAEAWPQTWGGMDNWHR
jgi:hypothetical protein